MCVGRPPPAGCAGPHRENWPEVGVPSRPRHPASRKRRMHLLGELEERRLPAHLEYERVRVHDDACRIEVGGDLKVG